MFVSNPFAELSASIPPGVMQAYVIVMIACVIGGTLIDIIHKGSARYFFANWRHAQKKGAREVGSGEIASLAVQTAAVDVLTSAEFCNQQRRLAHLLTMYGFLAYVISTVALVFCHPTSASAGAWPFFWTLGAIMICVGGGWFWFFIRADVSAEGQSPFRVMRADLFVLSLTLSALFGLIWSIAQLSGGGAAALIFLILYLLATTALFVGVPWSKFSHMFFKPAAALQKRVEKANGWNSKLPAPSSQPAKLGDPRRQPNHY